MEVEERALVADTLDQLVGSSHGGALTRALDDFGWRELLHSDPELAVPAVFGAQGRHDRWSGALHDVCELASDGGGDRPTGCTLLPWPGQDAPARDVGSEIVVTGLLLAPRDSDVLHVAVVGAGGVRSIVALMSDDLLVEDRRGLDPALGARQVTGVVRSAETVAVGEAAGAAWAQAEAHGRLALCHDIAACLRHMLDLARDHVCGRSQFGRVVGSFQAVRHKLAEALVAVVAAESGADAAWEADDPELAAATAKLVASNSVRLVTAHTQQALAGIGFTAEHPFHRYMKRAVVLDRVLGGATDLAPHVGRALILRGVAPRLVEL
jgi:hypothetical protein